MKQYIDKSAVVAEIDKYISNYKGIWNKVDKSSDGWVESTLMLCSKIDVLQRTLSFLDTLEVKEVELENEIDNQIRLLNGIHSMEDNHTFWKGSYNELTHFAKHFFELGIKTKGE